MTTYSFTLRLDGNAADSDSFADAVYGDGHDCTLSTCGNVTEADFSRDAPTFRDAVLSAIGSIHRADASVRVVGIFTDDQPIDTIFNLASA